MTGLWIVLGIFCVVALWMAFAFNSLVRRRNEIRNARSQIDVQLKRRHSLIPNLVEAVKDTMSFEQETLRQVTEARNRAVEVSGTDSETIGKAESELGRALGRLMAVVENYPDLKSNQNVSELQEELTSTENRIAYARQFLNDRVLAYNNMVQMFPSNLIAGIGGFAPETFLQIEAADREEPKVDLR